MDNAPWQLPQRGTTRPLGVFCVKFDDNQQARNQDVDWGGVFQ